MMSEERVSETLMLVSLRVSQWTGRKLDKGVSRDTLERYKAEGDAGGFWKVLLPELKPIQQTVNAARAEYYHLTSPWTDSGDRVCSVLLYDRLVTRMREYQETFNKQVREVGVDYNQKIYEQQKRLGEMFETSDYPTKEDFLRRFDFDWIVKPLPVSNDIRFKISDSERERIREETKRILDESLKQSVRDTWNRLERVIKHCYEKLNDKDAIFRDTLIENIRDLVQVIPGLNFTDDPDLTKLAREVNDTLCKLSPDNLRGRRNKDYRKDAADKAKDLWEKVQKAMPSTTEQEAVNSKIQDIASQARKFDSVL
jgi:hypothetical protein